jgi:hypothetical protein
MSVVIAKASDMAVYLGKHHANAIANIILTPAA